MGLLGGLPGRSERGEEEKKIKESEKKRIEIQKEDRRETTSWEEKENFTTRYLSYLVQKKTLKLLLCYFCEKKKQFVNATNFHLHFISSSSRVLLLFICVT